MSLRDEELNDDYLSNTIGIIGEMLHCLAVESGQRIGKDLKTHLDVRCGNGLQIWQLM